MKNISWVINGVLAVAVIILFILHFSSDGKKSETGDSEKISGAMTEAGNLQIAYVFVDSLLTHYTMYQDLTQELMKKKENLEKELTTKGSNLEKEITDFQYKVQKRLITSWDAADQEKRLQEKQQVLLNLQNDMQGRLMNDEQKLNIQLHDSIITAVDRYNETKGYQLILSHTFGGGLLYAPDYMNVTKEVLDLLNQNYLKSKSK